MNGFRQSKDFGNGVRPRTALGVDRPIWRLGALVSLPYNVGKVILVQRTGWEFVAEARWLQAPQGKRFARSWLGCSLRGLKNQKGKADGSSATGQPTKKGS
jgi:hypothetical protein